MRPILMPAALVATVLPLQAANPMGNDACMKQVGEGMALLQQNKYNEALARFEEGARLDPKASGPLSGRALVFLQASQVTEEKQVAAYRDEARRCAEAALAAFDEDPVAQEVLRLLEEGMDSAEASKVPEAREAFSQGEQCFARGDFDAAQRHFEAGLKRDPQHVPALISLGDCFFVKKDHATAEAWFRKALALDPTSLTGWRYLADACLNQGRHDQAMEALEKAIGLKPNVKASWDRLALVKEQLGTPMGTLKLVPRVRVEVDPKTRQQSIKLLQKENAKAEDTQDTAVWLALGLARVKATDLPGKAKPSAFAVDLEAWDTALAIAIELESGGKGHLEDKGLLKLLELKKAGDLKPALLLLCFREAYRADLEAWKKAEPEGIHRFIQRHRLRP